MLRALVVVALLPACLLAPDRPGRDGGTGDDGGGNGECTMPTLQARFPVTAVFETPSGEVLVRAGFDGGAPRVNFHDPGPNFSPICATRTVELDALGGIAVDDVLAVGTMEDTHLLVLVQRADGFAAVYQINMLTTPPALTPVAITSAAEIMPVAAIAGPFVAYSPHTKEVWFGGPRIFRANVSAGFGGPSQVMNVSGALTESWYLASPSSAVPGRPFVLIGQRADYAARYLSGTTIDVESRPPRNPSCDQTPADCADRIAREITNGPAALASIESLSFTVDGIVTAVDTSMGNVAVRETDLVAGVTNLFDLALHSFGTGTIDGVALISGATSGTRQIAWYKDVLTTTMPVPNMTVSLDAASPKRIVVGTFIPGASPRIYALEPQPALFPDGSRCFEIVNNMLVECSLTPP